MLPQLSNKLLDNCNTTESQAMLQLCNKLLHN